MLRKRIQEKMKKREETKDIRRGDAVAVRSGVVETLADYPDTSEFTIIDDILNTDIMKGKTLALTRGWKIVEFPHETIDPRIIAISPPGSYSLTRLQLKVLRREEFIEHVGVVFKDAVNATMENWKDHHLIEYATVILPFELSKIAMSAIKDALGPLLFDEIWKPMHDYIIDEIMSNFGPDILEKAGWEPGRAVHMVQIRNVNNFGFEWYSYGRDDSGSPSAIDWASIGTKTDPTELPPVINNALEKLKGLNDELADELAVLRGQMDQMKLEFTDEIAAAKARIEELRTGVSR